MKQPKGKDYRRWQRRDADRNRYPVNAVTQTNDGGTVNSQPHAMTQTNDGGTVNSQPRKRRSWVWDYFKEIKDANGKRCGAECKACRKWYKTTNKNGTSTLLKHYDKCSKKRNGDREEHPEMTTITNPVVSQGNVIVEQRNPVIGQSLDYNFLLENLVHYIPQLQQRGDLRPVIFRNYNEEKESLRNKLSFDRCSLSINLSRRANDAYCCLILHFIDDGWKPRREVLAFKRVDFCNKFLDLLPTILGTLSVWGNVERKLWCITAKSTDETDKLVDEIKKTLLLITSLPLGGKWSHVYCFSHFVNLLVQVGLQEVNDIYWKIRNCIFHVQSVAGVGESSLPVLDRVWSQIQEMNLRDIAAILNENLHTFGRMLSLKDGFCQLEKVDLVFRQLNLNKEEWNKATLIYYHLKEFDDYIQSLTVSEFLTANVCFRAVCCIYLCLRKWETDDNLCIKSMASKMKPTFEKYWQSSSGDLAIAVILNPTFKLKFVKYQFMEIFGNDADNEFNRVREILYKAYKGGYVTDGSDMPGTCATLFKAIGDGRSNKSELERYLEEPTITLSQDLDVLGWWHSHRSHFPRLAKMACDFLAIPMSAALSNPSFDDDVEKLNVALMDLDAEMIEYIMCLKYWSSTT